MTDSKRDVPYRLLDGPDGPYEDRSLTGSLIDGLERKVWRAQSDTQHRSPHLSNAEQVERNAAHFEHHIKAWDRPTMRLTKRIDGDDIGRHLGEPAFRDYEHER